MTFLTEGISYPDIAGCNKMAYFIKPVRLKFEYKIDLSINEIHFCASVCFHQSNCIILIMSRNTRSNNQTTDNTIGERSIFPRRPERKKPSHSGERLTSSLHMLQIAIPEEFMIKHSHEFRPQKTNASHISRCMVAQLACKYIQVLHERVSSLENGKYSNNIIL